MEPSMNCQHCNTSIETGYTLCPECELNLTLLILRLTTFTTPLKASLDSTLHPGGHQPTRTNLPTAPTPIRLDVLDLIDQLDATASELARWLEDSPQETAFTSIQDALIRCVESDLLPRFADAELYYQTLTRLEQRILDIIDTPEETRIVGRCPNQLCGITLTAPSTATTINCPICNNTWPIEDVKQEWLRQLIREGKKTGTAAECAKAFTMSGITLKRNTINQWAARNKITPVGIDTERTPIYKYTDIYRIATRKHQTELDTTTTVTA
jgi:ssDNA-binding Zn-finger/Zn-ribbon topoisomerase 1